MNSAAEPVTLLLFHLDGHRYALPSADVKEALPAVTIAPLPKAPAVVEGFVNVRGAVVPVLDVRARFRHVTKPAAPSDHLIVAHAGARVVALRVDRAEALITVDAADIDKAVPDLPGVGYVAGVLKLPDGLVLIHDLRSFLSETESLALSESVKCCEPPRRQERQE